MPWPVYTTQFVRTTPAAGATVTYTVPAGERAVVKAVDLVNSAAAAGNVQVAVGGVTVVYRVFQAGEREGHSVMTVVAYGGQEIQAYASVAGIRISVAGYLFEDVQGAEDPSLGADHELGAGPAWELDASTLPA